MEAIENRDFFLSCSNDTSTHTVTNLLNTLYDLCHHHYFGQQNAKMKRLLSKLLRLKAKSGYEHRSTPEMLGKIADIIIQQCLSYLSLPLLLFKVKLETKKVGYDDNLAATLYTIALVYETYDKVPEATQYFSNAFHLLRENKITRPNANMIYNIALFNYRHKLYTEAFENFNIAIKEHKQILGECHPDIAEMQTEVGIYELECGKTKDALNNFLEALVTTRMHFGNTHPKIADILYQIGLVHEVNYEYIQAMNAFNQALKISGVQIDKRSELMNKINQMHFYLLEEAA